MSADPASVTNSADPEPRRTGNFAIVGGILLVILGLLYVLSDFQPEALRFPVHPLDDGPRDVAVAVAIIALGVVVFCWGRIAREERKQTKTGTAAQCRDEIAFVTTIAAFAFALIGLNEAADAPALTADDIVQALAGSGMALAPIERPAEQGSPIPASVPDGRPDQTLSPPAAAQED